MEPVAAKYTAESSPVPTIFDAVTVRSPPLSPQGPVLARGRHHGHAFSTVLGPS